MNELFCHAIKIGAAILGTSLLIAGSDVAAQTPSTESKEEFASLELPTTLQTADESSSKLLAQLPEDEPTADPSSVLDRIEQYGNELNNGSGEDSLDQVTSVTQFRDVQPTDWAFEALRGLVERYGCIEGYPDQTYRGNRALTRYEFAAGLFSCLTQIERLIASTGGGLAPEDLERLQRLAQEFEAELATLGARVDNLEGRVAFLEDNQFSTTTKLSGEIIFSLASAFGDEKASGFDVDVDPPGIGEDVPIVEAIDADDDDPDLDSIVTFGNRVRLNFNTSFTGDDLLRTRLQARNIESLVTGTGMTALNFGGDNDNDIVLSDLFYIFPVGENLEFMVALNDVTFDDYVDALSPFFIGSANGALSLLGAYNILLYPSSDAGLIASYSLGDSLTFYAGYLTSDANEPIAEGGLFNGDFSALAQVNLGIGENLDIALTYTRTFAPGGSFGVDDEGDTIVEEASQVSLTEGLGSLLGDNPFVEDAGVSSNRFGATVSWQIAPRINIGAWFTYLEAEAESTFQEGDNAEIVTGVATLAILDIGKEGSVLGLIAGVPPLLTSNDGGSADEDIAVFVEAQYRFPLTDNITITPGAFVVFNPNHVEENDEIYVGVIETTFTF